MMVLMLSFAGLDVEGGGSPEMKLERNSWDDETPDRPGILVALDWYATN
jgi:hypothetical protein